MRIGEKIKELRETRRLTHTELANLLHCSVGVISLWENNLRTPNAESLVALAQFFGVTTDYLLGLED